MLHIRFVGLDQNGETYEWFETWDYLPRLNDRITFLVRKVYYGEELKERSINARIISVTWQSKNDLIVHIEELPQ